MSTIEQTFQVLSTDELTAITGGNKLGPGVYCTNVHGHAKCSVNQRELWGYTGRVIANGWINYGPWAPRPGFGVIVP